jgi:hypothetical protein
MVCGLALAFVACGGKKTEGTDADTTMVAPDTTAVVPMDTTRTDTAAVK